MKLAETIVNIQTGAHWDECSQLCAAAEREACALMCAMEENHGRKVAMLAAEYWLEELESLDKSSVAHERDWRKCTIATLSRLQIDGHLEKVQPTYFHARAV